MPPPRSPSAPTPASPRARRTPGAAPRPAGEPTAAINIRAHARFSEGVFAACPKLKIVSVWGTGTDNIDLNAAGMRGFTVCNTPGINAFAVAEHALTLMLTTARKVVTLDGEMRKGKWPREMLTQCLGKTLGVFGMGAIGGRPPPHRARTRRERGGGGR